jgi:hypothetical protein
MIHMMYLFDRRGRCLYYKEWDRPRNPLRHAPDEDQKLMFGMVHGMKGLCEQISTDPARESGLRRLRTPSFSLHVKRVLSGLMIVVATDNSVDDMKDTLNGLYADVFVPHVVRNPEVEPRSRIECPAFDKALEDYLKATPAFKGSR